MLIIGLTGMSGSGKSAVAELFDSYNIFTINADQIYHNMTAQRSPCLDALINEFGDRILYDDGSLNRSILREIVFSDDFKLKRLNSIAHSFVLDEIRKVIAALPKFKYKAVIVDAPQLFESGFDAECDIILSVIADESTKLTRLIQRDNISMVTAQQRLKSQLTDEYFMQHSDFVIFNNGNLDRLKDSVHKIVSKLNLINISEE